MSPPAQLEDRRDPLPGTPELSPPLKDLLPCLQRGVSASFACLLPEARAQQANDDVSSHTIMIQRASTPGQMQ